jgi:hypothetical protein
MRQRLRKTLKITGSGPTSRGFGTSTETSGRCIMASWARRFSSNYLARVLVEYSLDVKGMSFEQLTDPGVRDTEVMRELLADYAAGKL